MPHVELKNIRKSYGPVNVIQGVDLVISKGEFIVFVGPSGCGKSTLLRLISGLEDVSSGSVHIDDKDMTRVPPAKRGLAMVFQSYALFPHMSVAQNIGFGLSLTKTPKAEIDQRVREVASTLQLESFLDRTPRQLSGGQRQRVAIGRSIIRNPKVFLFDEPLSNLDASLRVQMRLEIANLHKRLPEVTMIYVTHDQVEAMTLADRIVVLNNGRIEQQGTPMELYDHPINPFVAGFIGAPSMNFIQGHVEGNGDIVVGYIRLVPNNPVQHRGKVTVGLRPEHISISPDSEGDFKARVELVEKLGSESLLYLCTEFSEKPLTMRVSAGVSVRDGDLIPLKIERSHMHVFAQ